LRRVARAKRAKRAKRSKRLGVGLGWRRLARAATPEQPQLGKGEMPSIRIQRFLPLLSCNVIAFLLHLTFCYYYYY
jgi:hypothetical protein